jgi:hypothetical protein
MTIHRIREGQYGISSHHCWRPGCFESERAAKYAFRFPDEILQRLQDSVNPSGVITFEMLQAAARKLKEGA